MFEVRLPKQRLMIDMRIKDAGNVKLREEFSNQPNVFRRRQKLVFDYLLELDERDLLQNYYLEAGLAAPRGFTDQVWSTPAIGHSGWEHPASMIRGHFTGHYLSAASRYYFTTGDPRLKYKIDFIVSELKRLQVRNGGRWAGSIPEKYFTLMAAGEPMWAPNYVVHKTLMGLFDAYKWASSQMALDVLENFAAWFTDWVMDFSPEKMDEILDYETGGMMEVWADLYSVTGKQEHLHLAEKYYRRKLFDRLIAGSDPLTNRHANTTIPEAHGAIRLYEVTGEQKYLDAAIAYWDCAVTRRGYFVTGSCNNEEMWLPPQNFAARLGPHTQEHCNVYNMIRLADYLFKATDDKSYLDYIELNIYNGLLAQQNSSTGMIAYYLPLSPGGRKKFSGRTDSFWCCCGTMIQAGASYNDWIYYCNENTLTVAQYIPSVLEHNLEGEIVRIEQYYDVKARSVQEINDDDYSINRPESLDIVFDVKTKLSRRFELALRIPEWISGAFELKIDGESIDAKAVEGFIRIRRNWSVNKITLSLPWKLEAVELPDNQEMIAFRKGPIAYAGLCGREFILYGDKNDADSLFNVYEEGGRGDQLFLWHQWYKSRCCQNGFILKPLYEITDEAYNVYFLVKDERGLNE